MKNVPAPNVRDRNSVDRKSVDRNSTDGVRRLAWLLDDMVAIPGTKIRIGLDALLGLLPAGGDLAGGVLSAYAILAAHRVGAGPAVILRMGVNILIDMIIGAVPLLGDLFDVGWKANRRNVALLDSYIASPQPVRSSSRFVVAAVLIVLFALLAGTAFISYRILRWVLAQF